MDKDTMSTFVSVRVQFNVTSEKCLKNQLPSPLHHSHALFLWPCLYWMFTVILALLPLFLRTHNKRDKDSALSPIIMLLSRLPFCKGSIKVICPHQLLQFVCSHHLILCYKIRHFILFYILLIVSILHPLPVEINLHVPLFSFVFYFLVFSNFNIFSLSVKNGLFVKLSNKCFFPAYHSCLIFDDRNSL